MYTDGPDGTRFCTEHQRSFKPPHACPKCKARPLSAPVASSGSPEFDRAVSEEIARFEGLADDFDAAGANAQTDAGAVGFARLRLSSEMLASKLRMDRANAARLARLKAGGKAATTMVDPREDWGTAADGQIIVNEGGN